MRAAEQSTEMTVEGVVPWQSHPMDAAQLNEFSGTFIPSVDERTSFDSGSGSACCVATEFGRY